MALKTLALLAVAHLAQAHFGIEYPPMRADTLSASHDHGTHYSQWIQPCAGVPGNLTDAPRTEWPLDGGSIKLDLHHKWTYIFINLGLGSDVSNFNYTLTNPFWNSTGNGTLCVKKLALPTNLPISDGSDASLQVVTIGENGNALYNCANIRFRANATPLSDEECVTEGVTYAPITAQASSGSDSSSTEGDGQGAGDNGPTRSSAGPAIGVNMGVLSSVAALTLIFAFGMSL